MAVQENLEFTKSYGNLKEESVRLNVKAFLLILILMIAVTFLESQVVARVGDYDITSDHLSQEIGFISRKPEYRGLSYLERREIALEQLINEQLLYLYALESRIEVTDQEVEQYFIAQFGDLPRFTTDGFFDRRKFQELKQTPEVRKILEELRRDLLITKTETILKDRFRYSDHQLLERYIIENSEIDISYAVIKEDEVNIPFFIHPFEAYGFYEENHEKYAFPDLYQIEFFIVPFDRYKDQFHVSEEELNTYFEEIEQISEVLRAEIRETIREEKIKSAAYHEADQLREKPFEQIKEETQVLSNVIYGDPFRSFNHESLFMRYNLMSIIKGMILNEFSEPIETDYGYLVFRVIGIKSYPERLDYPLTKKIWQDFINFRMGLEYREEYKEYYRANLNDFIIPAAHVTRLTINRDRIYEKFIVTDRQLRSFYELNRNLFTVEEQALTFRELMPVIRDKYFKEEMDRLIEWCRENIFLIGYDLLPAETRELENGVIVSNELIYLEMITNQDTIRDLIGAKLSEDLSQQVGSIKYEQDTVFYRINSFFPAYLPRFEDVEEHLLRKAVIIQGEQEIDYQEYYTKHLNLFAAPDSLKLTGIFVPVRTDTLSVSEEEIRQYYLRNTERFFSDPQIEIEYIYLKDPYLRRQQLLEEITGWLNDGVRLSLLQFSFGTELSYPQSEPFPQSTLPPLLFNVVNELNRGEVSAPIYYEEGWMIIRKKNDLPSRRLSFEEARRDLRQELLQKKGEEAAYQKARQFFIQVNSVRELRSLTDTTYVFLTEKKGVDSEFRVLGDISSYTHRLLNLRRNERLNTLFRSEKGFGVVFLLEKEINQFHPYEESLTEIKRLLSDDQKTSNAQNYARQLRELIVSGTDPDSLLFFLGGWKNESNLTFDDNIPKIEYSSLIIEDAIKRDVGEVSHVIRISNDEYAFYRVDRKREVAREAFQFTRDDYREYVADKEFREWLDQYRKSKVVEKY